MSQQPLNDHARQRVMEDYIRENQETYTRKSITDVLLAMGYDLQEIDRAWDFIQDTITPKAPDSGHR